MSNPTFLQKMDELASEEKPAEEKPVELSPLDTIRKKTSIKKPEFLEKMEAIAPAEPEASFTESAREFIQGLGRGAREEIAPFSFDEREVERIKTEPFSWSQTAGEVVGGMGSGLAAAIAAGKTGAAAGSLFGPLGTAVGAGVGVLGYALYSGIGQEKLQADLGGQEFSPTRAAARTLLNVNPAARASGEFIEELAKKSPKLAKAAAASEKTGARVARGAAQTAGEVGVAASTFGVDAATVTGVVSSVISPLVFGRSAAAPSPRSVQTLEQYLESDVGKSLVKRVGKKAQAIADKQIELTDELKYEPAFMEYFLSRPGFDHKKDITSKSYAAKKAQFDSYIHKGNKGGITEEKLNHIYKGYLLHKEMINEASKVRQELQEEFSRQAFAKGGKEDFDPFPGIVEMVGDGQYIARATDRMFGTNTTTLLNNISETRGKFEVTAGALYKKAIDASKKQRRIKINGKKMTNEQMGRLRVYFSENNPRSLTPELRTLIDFNTNTIKDPKVREAVAAWDDAWEGARDAIQEHNYKIGNIKHYLPLRFLPKDKLATRVRRSMESLQGMSVALGKKSVFNIDENSLIKAGFKGDDVKNTLDEIKNIRDMAGRAANKEAVDVTTSDVGSLIKNLISEHGEDFAFGGELGVIHTRQGQEIADRFREYDIGASFKRYINTQLRISMYSDVNRRMLDNLEVMKALGATKAADWFDDHLKDIVGGGQNAKFKVASAIRNRAGVFKYRATRLLENAKMGNETTDSVINLMPELLSTWQANLYPAYLGYNVKATLRNLTQPFAMLAPELGGTEGYSMTLKAYIRILGQLKDPKTNKIDFTRLAKNLDDIGLGGSGRLAESLQDPLPLGAVGRGAKAVNDVGMAIYSSADILNRAIAYDVGQQMAERLILGNKKTMTSLQNLGDAAKAQLQAQGIREAIQENNAKKLGDILGKFLVGKTQYHYGPEQKSKFARYMGPLFSMFSKWPSSVMGNLYDIWKENPGAYRKMRRYGQVYGAPLMFLSSVDYAKEQLGLDEAGLVNYLIGDAVEVSPLLALEFTLFQNPAAELGEYFLGVGRDVLKDPGEKSLRKGAKRTAKKLLETSAPPLSSVYNELQKLEKRGLGKTTTTTDELLDEIFGE